MGRTLPACAVILGVVLSGCSKQSARQAPAASSNSSSAAPPTPATLRGSQQVGNFVQTAPLTVLPDHGNLMPASAASVTIQQPASESAPPLLASDDTQGPFHIGDQSFTFAKRVQKIQGANSTEDATVEWWELRDASGKPVYHQQYTLSLQNGRFDDTEDVGARELKTKFGQGILIDGQSLPSAPNSGTWVQVWGLFDGKLVPFSSPISTDGEFEGEEVETFQPSSMFRGQQPAPVSRDILKFRIWTGNVNIVYGVQINWIQAKLFPAWTCMSTTSQGRSSACTFKVEVEPATRTEMSFVRLFSEPDSGSTPKHVVIKAESQVQFVEAQAAVGWSSTQTNTTFGIADADKVWLHIKVDGEDGWISGQEDFNAVGLPFSG